MSTIRFGRLDPVLLFLPVLLVLIASLASVSMPELMNPAQSGKFIFFNYVVLVLFFLFLIVLPFRKWEHPLKVTWIDLLLLLYLVWITVNRYFLQPEYGFSMRYIELIGLAGVYLIIRQVDPRYIPWLLLAGIVSGVIQAIYGIMQLYGHAPSYNSNFMMTGSFFNPGPYSGFLASVFPVALGIFLFEQKRMEVSPDNMGTLVARLRNFISPDFRYYLFYLVVVVGLFTLILVLPAARSRASWIAVGVSSLFLVSIRYGFKQRIKAMLNTNLKKIFAGIAVFTLFGILGVGLYYFKKDSADGRFLIWKVTLNMIADQPWTGYGFDRFKAHYMNYQAAYFERNPNTKEAHVADNVYYAFNEPLQVVAENGVIALVILGVIGFLLFTSGLHENNFWVSISLAGVLSIFVFSLFSYPAQILPIKLNLLLFLAIVQVVEVKQTIRIRLPGSRLVMAAATSVNPILFFGAILLWRKVDILNEDYRNWQGAYRVYQFGLYEEASEEYDKVICLKSDGDFLMNYGKALSMAGIHQEAISTLTEAKKYLNTTIIETALGDSQKATGKFLQAEQRYFQAWYMAPSRFYPKYLLVKLYDEIGKKEKALTIAQELMIKEIKIQSVAIKEIRSEMEKIIEKYGMEGD